MADGGMSTTLLMPLCDWCRTHSADGWWNNDPCCIDCADGLLQDSLPLAVQHQIEDRTRLRPPSRQPDGFYLRTPERWLAENGWYRPATEGETP